MTERTRQALQNFAAGYCCAQSVAMAYADAMGMTEEQAARVSVGFGAGIGRMRGNCGAFSVAVMVCGFLEPSGHTPEGRAPVYARVQEVHRAFAEKCGSVSCGELLQRHPKAGMPVPEARTPAYYASRPCARVILQACRIIEEQMRK